MELINRAEWESLVADPRFHKYRDYLKLWLEHIKDRWADGEIVGELENADAAGKTQFLKDQIDLDYEDIRRFFVETGSMKDGEDINTED